MKAKWIRSIYNLLLNLNRDLLKVSFWGSWKTFNSSEVMHWLKIGFDVVDVASGYHGYEYIALFIVMQWLAALYVFCIWSFHHSFANIIHWTTSSDLHRWFIACFAFHKMIGFEMLVVALFSCLANFLWCRKRNVNIIDIFSCGE